MNEKKHRLLFAIGEVDEKYVKEAEGKMTTGKIIKIAAAFAIVIAISLYLFIPFRPVTSDLSDYENSSYFSLIEGIEDYRLSFMQPTEKNNFEVITQALRGMFGSFGKGGADGDSGGGSSPSLEGSNGSYVEATDNQVAGVVEADLFKMSDKYIFRLGGSVLYVYSIDKENSELVSSFGINGVTGSGKGYFSGMQMYLSEDCKTVTVLEHGNDSNGQSVVGIISLDVSDVSNITQKGVLSLQGLYKTSRMVDGKLLLVTEYYFNRNSVDYNDPKTFVPTVNDGNGDVPIEFEDIIFPDKVGNTGYSVVALVDAENMTLLGANALLNFTSDIYISAENVYITREYTKDFDAEQEGFDRGTRSMSDVAVLGYTGVSLENKGVITLRGVAEDQYNFDEKDGYLRVVTSTRENYVKTDTENSSVRNEENVSLYIYDLADNSLAYSVEDFAIEGEEATAVRFDGDMLYVCTAEVVSFTDPVYFFDLSDYNNISSTDTGVIEGFSTSLINLGEGFLLGIGEEDWQYNKVEVYEQRDGQVISVDEFKFGGSYSRDYKAYLVNREENLFGFSVYGYYGNSEYLQRYILLQFDGYKLNVVCDANVDKRYSSEMYRAAYIDGYLYITSPDELFVEKIN